MIDATHVMIAYNLWVVFFDQVLIYHLIVVKVLMGGLIVLSCIFYITTMWKENLRSLNCILIEYLHLLQIRLVQIFAHFSYLLFREVVLQL